MSYSRRIFFSPPSPPFRSFALAPTLRVTMFTLPNLPPTNINKQLPPPPKKKIKNKTKQNNMPALHAANECKVTRVYGKKTSLKSPLYFKKGARLTGVSFETEEGLL